MKRLRWSLAAAGDLESIGEYLKQHHSSFAGSTIKRLYGAAKSLKKLPNVSRIGRKSGTREFVLTPLPYVVVYSVTQEFIHILRILHTSQNWP